ncbi:hypothetical protein ACWKWN_12905 [Microbacterium trichothecenolyticum]
MMVGKVIAGRTVTLWSDLSTIHVLFDDDVIKTIPSHLTTAELVRLTDRGARVPCRLEVVEGAFHAFDLVFAIAGVSRHFRTDTTRALGEALSLSV